LPLAEPFFTTQEIIVTTAPVPAGDAAGRGRAREFAGWLFSFPHPVNEVSARLVAAGVAVMAAVTIAADLPWMTAVIAYGFVARVLTGPKLSPLGLLVTRVITPRLPVAPKLVPGPPKRFAQGLGAALTVTAAVLALGFGQHTWAYVILGGVIAAAILEAVFAFCVGCTIFAGLMRLGVIPETICAQCAEVETGTRITQVGTQPSPLSS
jgi:hypothetical protein